MKISYERLNQIIEEEVVRFKGLNEEQDPIDTLFNQIMGAVRNDADKKKQVLSALQGLKATLKIPG